MKASRQFGNWENRVGDNSFPLIKLANPHPLNRTKSHQIAPNRTKKNKKIPLKHKNCAARIRLRYGSNPNWADLPDMSKS
jgi:hypothetical protein